MELTSENIAQIRQQFASMSTKEDFVNLLNYAKKIAVGKNAVPFELKQITYYANPKVSGIRYKTFAIKKKSGGIRTIHSPVKGLSIIQRCLNLVLQCVFTPHDAAKGFVPGKSIVDNAKAHIGRNYVFNIDLKDFFPSIDQARVWKCLQLMPFNLKTAGRVQLANMISSLCCTEMIVERLINEDWMLVKKNVLPQGAATSPIITNIICQRLDYLLTGVAKRFGLRYTRYADDITFSSQHNIFKEDGEFNIELRRIITEQGFHIKESKVRLQHAAFRQEVTGLVVNKAVNVSQSYIKQLRMWLYNWERYGYDRAYSYFLPSYFASKTNPIKGKPDMANVIDGKLNYLKMVKGRENVMYLKLRERFDSLIGNSISVKKILDIWELKGIEKAMEVFYNNKADQYSSNVKGKVL
jgi:hypothetical protein